ncbi:PucR family transcriptional regulator [Nocardioides sp. LHG3406-4]|uniref:PucR family transcriptional regulator n=1 Tax=Nocardioides sp. LHG3406-4 TaxID=2804575 RepID=UPI003CEFFED5
MSDDGQSSREASVEEQGSPGPDHLTVRELLEQPCMETASILAGASGQDTPIGRMNVMTLPEIVRWVERNEFLLTTGFPLRAHGDPVSLIRDLSELKLAGLAVKFDTYLPSFDADVLAAADELAFPIVAIPVDVRFDDILSEAFETIINRQAAELSRSHRLHYTFLGLTFSGGGMPALMEELARLLGARLAAVVDSQGTVLAHAGTLDALRCLSADLPAEPVAVDPSSLHKGHHSEDGHSWVVVPIAAAATEYGHVVVVGGEGELGPYAMTAAEQAAIVSTLEMIRGQAVRAVSGRFASNLLHELMTGDDLEGISARAAALDWALNRDIVVVAARPDDGRPVSAPVIEQAQVREQRTSERWAIASRRIDPHGAAGVLGAQLVAVLGGELAKPGAIAALQAEMSTSTRREFAMGVSRCHHGLAGIRGAYEEALRALRLGARVNGPHAITQYDGLGLFRLLAQLDEGELEMFVADTLGPVLDLPEPERTDLVQTLDVLLANHLNIAQSAREMHYHYNTLRSRMIKLEKLLGGFSTDAVTARRIGVALEIMRMQGGRPL